MKDLLHSCMQVTGAAECRVFQPHLLYPLKEGDGEVAKQNFKDKN